MEGMADFPNIEARMLHVGLTPTMAQEIAAEVPDVKTAFHTYFSLGLVAACGALAVAAVQLPIFFIVSNLIGGGDTGNCSSGSRNLGIAIFFQIQASILSSLLLQWTWLIQARRKTRMRFLAAQMLFLYSGGAGAGATRGVLEKHPEIRRPDDLVLRNIKPRLRFWSWGLAVLHAASIGMLFFPAMCR